ncbi:DUF4388 domain-containing protein [Phytohabitans suffuscus]|uniref:DUF4388 domain-containing protein n=1 Tax=Phytohabitans suffuscus TaxID=624315 RepID=A0A6F8YEG4_9ACTN|nr:DUF4388 domain-containing protein [Phytohabitans suffuscus]BCB84368.1 hypothetical protein Psuf_016810 [Phytohabitans suffuscus]
MKTPRTGRTVPPRRTLSQLSAAGETGALHVEGDPGGTVYLTDGWISYIESPASPGVGELLTTSGRLPGEVWQAAAASGDEVGPLLVAQGHLTRGELELCTLGAIYDAAFFVLSPAPTRVRFEAGERHRLGPICQVDAAVLGRELTRRRKLLDDAHPSSDVDTGRLLAAPRAPVPRLVVTGPQWELIVHCDGHRTAADLARLLGRAGYTTLLELRRLAAAGLVTARADDPAAAKADRPAPAARADGPAAARSDAPARPAPDRSGGAPAAQKSPAPQRATGSRRTAAAAPAAGGGRPAQSEPRLPRRGPGQQLSGPDPPPAYRDELDETLLTRIRSGLEAL